MLCNVLLVALQPLQEKTTVCKFEVGLCYTGLRCVIA